MVRHRLVIVLLAVGLTGGLTGLPSASELAAVADSPGCSGAGRWHQGAQRVLVRRRAGDAQLVVGPTASHHHLDHVGYAGNPNDTTPYGNGLYQLLSPGVEALLTARFGKVATVRANHHGSEHASSASYLAGLDPQTGVISCGVNS